MDNGHLKGYRTPAIGVVNIVGYSNWQEAELLIPCNPREGYGGSKPLPTAIVE